MFDFARTKAVHPILCNTIVGSLSKDENLIAHQNICLLILPQFAVDLSVMEQFFAAAGTEGCEEADAEMIGTNLEYFYGEIHGDIKKRILKEKYQVDWQPIKSIGCVEVIYLSTLKSIFD